MPPRSLTARRRAQRRALRRARHFNALVAALAGSDAGVFRLCARAPGAIDDPQKVQLLEKVLGCNLVDDLFLLLTAPGACARPTMLRIAYRDVLLLDALEQGHAAMARALVALGAEPSCANVWRDLNHTSLRCRGKGTPERDAATYRLCARLAASPGKGAQAFRGFPRLCDPDVAREELWAFLASGAVTAARFIAARAGLQFEQSEVAHILAEGRPRGAEWRWGPRCTGPSRQQLISSYLETFGKSWADADAAVGGAAAF